MGVGLNNIRDNHAFISMKSGKLHIDLRAGLGHKMLNHQIKSSCSMRGKGAKVVRMEDK
jgi:hypothetical protein